MRKVASLILTSCLLVSTIPVQAVSFNVSTEENVVDSSLQCTPMPTPTTEVQENESLQENENQIQTYATIVADGYCGGEGDGTNLTWTLYSDGELEIRGTGKMSNYSYTSGTSSAPWYGYRNDIVKLTLSDGITSIGDYAFMTVLVYRGYCNI